MHIYAYIHVTSTIRTKNKITGYSLYIQEPTKSKTSIYNETKNRHVGLKIDPGIGLKINRYRPKTYLKIALSLSAAYSSFKNIEAVIRASIQVIRNIETMPHENK